MNDQLQRTPLFDWHRDHGGRMVPFSGWEMPVQYASIVAEHQATRNAATLFDISHMGRFRFDGPGSAQALDRVLTRRVTDLKPDRVRYSLVTNESGGILDDVLVSRIVDGAGGSYYLLVVNAGNRPKLLDWISGRVANEPDVAMQDLSDVWAMVAVQGPLALALAQNIVPDDVLGRMPYYTARETRIAGHGGIVSRTGYTGEDGVELIVGSQIVERVWEQLLSLGAEQGVIPAGLGARDTLRLEAGMPLYGHELSESINPFAAGLEFAVELEDREFVGSRALAELRTQARPHRVGLLMDGKRVPREGFPVLAGESTVGRVTSGTYSPTLARPIAMAYVEPGWESAGTRLTVEIRGHLEAAVVTPLPFYRRGESAAVSDKKASSPPA